MASRTLVQLDDKIVQITEGKDGKLQTKPVTEDELVEISLLDDGVQKFLENDMNRLANEAYDELKKSFKQTFKTNVLKVVGFDNRWNNNWEVDHCNGRSSELTTFMSDKVRMMFRTEFDKLVQPEIEEILKPLKKQLTQEFKEVFLREARSTVRAEAVAAARAFTSNLMAREVKKFQKKAIEEASQAFLGRSTKNDSDN